MERTRNRMLTTQEAALQLGLSPATLRAWIWRRKIEYTRIGRAVRISEAVVNSLLERGTVPVIGHRDT